MSKKSERHKAIDKAIRQERHIGLRKWIMLIIGILVVLIIYTPIFSERITGETIGFRTDDVGNVSKIEMRIKLDTGDEIAILVDKNVVEHVGRKVEISKMKSVAGMSSYQFIQYVVQN